MHSVNPEPSRVAATISSLAFVSTTSLNAYWLAVVGDRDDYAARLTPLLAEQGMALLIVRNERFDNPNSLMADVAHILEGNREVFLAALRRRRPDARGISIVLLARTDLAMGQGSSPVIWPEWVPDVGGRQVACFITDVTRHIDAPLDAAEADIHKVSRALYAVESALVRRLMQVSSRNPQDQAALFAAIGRRTDSGWLEFLARAKSSLKGVGSTDSYRPSVRRGESVVSRLWEIAQTDFAKDLKGAAQILAAALWICDQTPLEGWREGLFGVLSRPGGGHQSSAERFCLNAVHTISMACQYVTCAAHAGDYSPFPINLIISVVDELYRSLVSIEVALIHIPDAGTALAAGERVRLNADASANRGAQ